MGTTEGQKIRYETSGQAIEVGKNAIGNVADRLKASRPTIILETEKNFAAIFKYSASWEDYSALCANKENHNSPPCLAMLLYQRDKLSRRLW